MDSRSKLVVEAMTTPREEEDDVSWHRVTRERRNRSSPSSGFGRYQVPAKRPRASIKNFEKKRLIRRAVSIESEEEGGAAAATLGTRQQQHPKRKRRGRRGGKKRKAAIEAFEQGLVREEARASYATSTDCDIQECSEDDASSSCSCEEAPLSSPGDKILAERIEDLVKEYAPVTVRNQEAEGEGGGDEEEDDELYAAAEECVSVILPLISDHVVEGEEEEGDEGPPPPAYYQTTGIVMEPSSGRRFAMFSARRDTMSIWEPSRMNRLLEAGYCVQLWTEPGDPEQWIRPESRATYKIAKSIKSFDVAPFSIVPSIWNASPPVIKAPS